MPKEDKDLIPGYDVQVIPVAANGAPVPTQSTSPAGIPTQVPGNGYVLTSGANTPIIVVPQQPQQPVQPSLVVITLAPKKEEKKEKKTSSVFQRL
jgi:hypothetical protein